MACGAVCFSQKSMGKIGVSPAHKTLDFGGFGGLKLLYLSTDWSMCMVLDLGYKKRKCMLFLWFVSLQVSSIRPRQHYEMWSSYFSFQQGQQLFFSKKGPQHCWLVHMFLFYTPSNQTSMTRGERIHPTNMFQQVQRILGGVFTRHNKPVTY